MIPLGVTFLLVGALACLIAYANVRALLRAEDKSDREDHRSDWNWPERGV